MTEWTAEWARHLAREHLDAVRKSPTHGVEGTITGGHFRIAYVDGTVYVKFRQGTEEFFRRTGLDFEFIATEL